jgi:Flp pilus assembly protein TadG
MGKEAGVLGICELWRRRERGASLVELSLVLFILLLLMAGVIDFGRVFNSYVVITNASREGARYASRYAPRPEDADSTILGEFRDGIVGAVEQEAAVSSVDPEELDITTDPDLVGATVESGNPITVTVQYTVPTIIANIAGFGELPLRARTTMVVFGQD